MVSVEALARASVEEPLVQILIVVVIRNMKSISAEANKVISKMVFSWEWVDPKRRLKQLYIERNWAGGNSGLSNSSMSRKGNRLKFRYWVRVWGLLCAFWDLFVVTQKNLKTVGGFRGRDLCSVQKGETDGWWRGATLSAFAIQASCEPELFLDQLASFKKNGSFYRSACIPHAPWKFKGQYHFPAQSFQ